MDISATDAHNITEYRCRLKSAQNMNPNFSPCNKSLSFSNLSPGDYTFEAYAIDELGNQSPNVGTYAFVIQSPPPVVNFALLSWDANAETDLAGYKIYYGTSPGVYTQVLDVGYLVPDGNGRVSYQINSLQPGTRYYFAVSAYDNSFNESPKSMEVSKQL